MIFRLAIRTVIKHWRKSFAAILAISSSFVAQCIFVGYIDYVEKLFVAMYSDKQMFGDIIIEDDRRMSSQGKDDPLKYSIPGSVGKQIAQWVDNNKSEVDSYVQFLNFSGMISNGKTQLVVVGRGHDFNNSQKMRRNFSWDTKYGIPLEQNPLPLQAVLGVRMGNSLGCTPTPEVKLNLSLNGYPPVNRPFHCDVENMQVTALTESGQINALDFHVGAMTDGGIRELDARLLLTDLKSVQTLLNTDKINYATLKWEEGRNTTDQLQKLNSYLKSIDPHLHAISWKVHESGAIFVNSMSILNVFRFMIVIIVLIITGMSVFNTSLKSVLERVKEIGALLSMGFRKVQILKIFVCESLILCLIGNFFGALISVCLTFIINGIGIEYKAGIYSEAAIFYINILPSAYLTAMMITLTVSGLTTYLTVKKFLKKRIIQNLNA